MIRLFFSYSHRDETLRNELQAHLATLTRQGIIETWHDRRIGAGEGWASEISEHLEKADIILLLVSSDFINSDYCYGIEMDRALQRHENGEARVIPVILRPCLWQPLPFGKLQATPTGGTAVTKFPNMDDAFLEVTNAIHDAVKKLGTAGETGKKPQTKNQRGVLSTDSVAGSTQSNKKQDIRSSNLRIKKQFTDHEKDQFLDEAFEYIANYFENSLAELETRNPQVSSRFRRIDSNHFSAAAYVDGVRKSGCRIWIGGQYSSSAIYFSFNESGADNSYNETLRVEDDGYSMFLKAMGVHFQYQVGKEPLTNEGGAEYFWHMFIESLQR